MSNTTEQYYLKEEVYFEPLINSWFAWPYLIPPVTGARHMVNTHRRIMTSFVNNYKLHILANKEPGMAGAEFLDCTESQVADIKQLIADINTKHADLVELSQAVKQLDDLMRAHTSGESIEYLYEQIPGPLKGYVELNLDMYHNPSYRLLESLLYKSPLYKTSLQTVSFGMMSKVGERPFVLSTPRLPDENHLQVNADYNNPVLSKILATRDIPLTMAEIDALFAQFETSGGLDYKEMFTTERGEKTYLPVEEGVRINYIGHAGFLIETSDVAIMIDPVIASRDEKNGDNVISFNQLPEKIDYICLTHLHQDHVNFETLLQLRHKIGSLVVPKNNGGSLADPSMKMLLQQFGFNVIEMDDMESFDVSDGRIMALPFLGEHGDLNIRSKAAWYLELHGKKMFLGADSSNLDPNMYRHIQAILGDIDVMAIGMECIGAPYTWLYGALATKMVSRNIKESRRLNGADYEQAMNMIDIFSPKRVFIYALGMEPWYKYFMGIEYDDDSEQIVQSGKMLEECERRDIPAERLYGTRELNLL